MNFADGKPSLSHGSLRLPQSSPSRSKLASSSVNNPDPRIADLLNAPVPEVRCAGTESKNVELQARLEGSKAQIQGTNREF